MKTFKYTLVLILCVLTTQGHAQFWKKIKDRATEAAERTVERKIEEKSERATESAFDSLFNSPGKLLKGKRNSAADIYQFDSQYTMRIVQKKDTTNFTYYFGEDPAVLGSSIELKARERVISVIDLNRNTIYNFMDLGDTKSSASLGITPKMVQSEASSEDVSAEPTGEERQILGYSCQEYEVIGEDYYGTVWVTEETDISYPEGFKEITTSKSKGIDQRWMKLINGIPLEMKMTDTSRNKPRTVHMLCIDLGPTDFTVIPSDYKSAF